ncbi:MAG: hypothetical protein QF858_01835 [Candidatus Pacebacteria bacterium]|jgi:hypothetical protein|nr:hypothetical protein [bacterium]MDP6527600.1 hypothetical protein [Candidatus Paceibacterota bacterium]MDP6659546.1 hypothetical protein [Candidatus Paceibacterota bacterium]|tara:strand:- start:2009 stop:2659 length:651 start_codon:yes stop_codon:yes gene_type:complete
MEILSKLFGSQARVKVMRLFLFNEGESFENSDVAKRARVLDYTARSETRTLESAGLIKRISFFKEVMRGRGKNKKLVKKRVKGFTLNPKFKYLQALRNFLINAAPLQQNEIVKKLSGSGSLKLVIISGVFIQDWDSRIDILIVGDNIKTTKLEAAIKGIEADIGRELRYAIFPTKEFKYRLNVYDKLIRDVLDYPHQTVVDRLGEWQSAEKLKVTQ